MTDIKEPAQTDLDGHPGELPIDKVVFGVAAVLAIGVISGVVPALQPVLLGTVLSEQSRRRCRGAISCRDEQACQSVPVLQLLAGSDPRGGDAVHPLPALAAQH